MRCFLDTPLVQLRQEFFVCFDARLCVFCICASSLLSMHGYSGDGLQSDALLSKYSICVSCNKWSWFVSMLGCVALVLVRIIYLRCLVTQATASCQLYFILDTPLACLATSGLGWFRCQVVQLLYLCVHSFFMCLVTQAAVSCQMLFILGPSLAQLATRSLGCVRAMLRCLAPAYVHTIFQRCMVTQAAASSQMLFILGTSPAWFRQQVQVAFDFSCCAEAPAYCMCTFSLSQRLASWRLTSRDFA